MLFIKQGHYMNITIKNNFGNYNSYITPHNAFYNTNLLNKNEYDSFEVSNSNAIFTGKTKSRKQTKRVEEQLRDLDNVHDPYSDVILISKKKFKNLQDKLSKRTEAESTIKLLSNYKKHMFPISEGEVFEFLKEETKQRKRNKHQKSFDFHDILMDELPNSKARLIEQELNIVEQMEHIAKKLDKHEQHEVKSILGIIKEDIYNDNFRIKPTRELLINLNKVTNNQNVVDKIVKKSKEFPNSMTSFDAFVVKNANNTHQEIAEALISPAIISLEHIKPQSDGGETKGGNSIAASRRMNNYRQSTPLNEFIEEFPNIPFQTQRYINDLKQKINRGGIPDIAYTLPEVKESLRKESHGLINIDISDINPKVSKETTDFRSKIDKLVEHFKTKE